MTVDSPRHSFKVFSQFMYGVKVHVRRNLESIHLRWLDLHVLPGSEQGVTQTNRLPFPAVLAIGSPVGERICHRPQCGCFQRRASFVQNADNTAHRRSRAKEASYCKAVMSAV